MTIDIHMFADGIYKPPISIYMPLLPRPHVSFEG